MPQEVSKVNAASFAPYVQRHKAMFRGRRKPEAGKTEAGKAGSLLLCLRQIVERRKAGCLQSVVSVTAGRIRQNGQYFAGQILGERIEYETEQC